MQVVAIHLGADHGGPVAPMPSVRARAGMGLEGDRHFHAQGGADPGEALTLVEEEVVDEVGLPPGATRRQVTVRGVRLNELIGRVFTSHHIAMDVFHGRRIRPVACGSAP